MKETEFDREMTEALEGLEPQRLPAEQVNPWGRVMKLLLWGLLLSTLRLEVALLQYVLPFLGAVLTLLGYRALRRENPWGRTGWWVSILLVTLQGLLMGLQATRWWPGYQSSSIAAVVTGLGVGLDLLLTCCLWGCLRGVRRQAGQPPGCGSVGALFCWKLVLTAMALWQVQGWIPVLAMLGVLVAILVQLRKVFHLLDRAGYTLIPAPVRLSDGALGGLCVGAVALCVCLGLALFSRWPMEYAPVEQPALSQTAQEGREALAELGLPDQILTDLSQEVLENLAGAEQIFGADEAICIYRGNLASEYLSLEDWEEAMSHSDGDRLSLDLVIRLPGERYGVLHYLYWLRDPVYRGNEGIELWPAWQYLGYSRPEDAPIQGQLLYERQGRTWGADFASLTLEPHPANGFFGWAEHGENLDIIGRYTLPLRGSQIRAYVFYEVTGDGNQYLMQSYVNYIHQRAPAYPFRAPVRVSEYRGTGSQLFQSETRVEELEVP